MKKGILFILSGPSGSGKTTLTKKLLNQKKFKGKLVESVSATTRPRRRGETHGRDYFFISEKMFKYKIRAGHFLEWEKVFTAYYGTLQKNVRDVLSKGKSILLCIDVKGARTVVRKFPQACSVFIQAPSMSVLKERLIERNTENSRELKLRLKTAQKEMKEAKQYEFVIVNDNFQTAYKELEKIIWQKLKER